MSRLRIFLIVLLLASSFKGVAQNIYLLSVGISDYPASAPVNDLNLPVEDARALHELYMRNPRTKAVLLTNANARKDRIMSEAGKLFKNAQANDIVIFFFSGHGDDITGSFIAYDGFLKYDEIRKMFSGCKARNKMIFADACCSGGLRESSREGYVDNVNNVMLFLSSRTNESSIEHEKMKNGMFTTCLLRSLRGGADKNRDKVITAQELFVSVSNGVKKLTSNRQHPVMWGNFADDMPVMVWK